MKKTLTKKDLANVINKKLGYSKEEAKGFTQVFFNSIINNVVSINKFDFGIELNKSDKYKMFNIELLSDIRTDIVGTRRATKATSENPEIATNKYK